MNKTLIIGAGRSALGAARLLLSQGHKPLVSDIAEKFPDVAQEIRNAGAELVIGPQTPELLTGITQLVVSPGLSPDIPILQEARRRRQPILSEIDVALDVFDGTVMGVTGTNGKSTTTTLLAHLLQELGNKAEASGNIGVAPSLVIAEGRVPEIFVLELSSYQLDFSQPIRNHCSLFMSFSSDHLERHGTMENYFRAKWKLMMATVETGSLIMPRRILEYAKQYGMPVPKAPITQITVDAEVPFGDFVPTRVVHIDSQQGRVSGDGFPQPEVLPAELSFHNQLNVVASILAVRSLVTAPWPQLMQSVASYEWLPYRFQKIGSLMGHPVFNDSKSTNVESTLVALQSMRVPAIVMLGGHPKGESFAPVADFRDRILKLVAFGAAGPKISCDLQALNPIVFPTLKAALSEIPTMAGQHPAPIVFSPACSSFDEFKNFEERGAFFNQILVPLLDKT
ncbi:MAG: UDP-N-acetylmuramoyl-L-alanine--D-glutamate ligase [Pseudobdellovibrionaceae bacterium]|nr:UDP-N-acetylmuramoyl-L-alanine--D-glutamate ligase [Pseudobdellovibrionaceae bacterium]